MTNTNSTETVQFQGSETTVGDRIAVYLPSLDRWTDGGHISSFVPGGVITEDGFYVESALMRVKK
jgi:hypothetical protein